MSLKLLNLILILFLIYFSSDLCVISAKLKTDGQQSYVDDLRLCVKTLEKTNISFANRITVKYVSKGVEYSCSIPGDNNIKSINDVVLLNMFLKFLLMKNFSTLVYLMVELD